LAHLVGLGVELGVHRTLVGVLKVGRVWADAYLDREAVELGGYGGLGLGQVHRLRPLCLIRRSLSLIPADMLAFTLLSLLPTVRERPPGSSSTIE
jgi:hypothetical protein